MSDAVVVDVLHKTKQANRKDVYLYSHWGGSGIVYALKMALIEGRDWWDDDEYLTGMIFMAMMGDDNMDNYIGPGFGISLEPSNSDYNMVFIYPSPEGIVEINGKTFTFQEFIDADSNYLNKLLKK